MSTPSSTSGLSIAGLDQVGVDSDGPDVGEHAKLRPQFQQAVFGPHGGGGVVPLGAAHRAEKHGIGGAGEFPHLVEERGAVPVNGDAANVAVLKVEAVPESLLDGLQRLDGFLGNFGADAVAAQHGNV